MLNPKNYATPDRHNSNQLFDCLTSKKLPNVYKSCPKMISLEEKKDFDTFTKIA